MDPIYKLKACTNCGIDTYELIDGCFYCTECNERFMNVVAIENEEFAFTGTQKSELKVKGKEKAKQKAQEENQFRRTSYEEYNYILHGLTNEILELEHIPNFKVTVLQLWIAFLKATEAGFVDEETLALPKFFVRHRQADAEILYNKRPKPKKKYAKKKDDDKKKKDTDGETVLSFRKRSRKIRKGLALLDTSETTFSSSTSMSSLASMSIDDITSMRDAQELNIEYSNVAKDIKKAVLKQKEKYGRNVKFNDDEDVIVTSKDLQRIHRVDLMLNEKTLIYILYSALNICGSRIQLGDLMRFTREGHISFYNFLNHIPEIHRERLSLTKGHSFAFNKAATIRSHLFKFVEIIPDLRTSFKLPNLKLLVQRYLKELSLPAEIYDYIDRLINFLPPEMKFDKFVPNYEARAVAYIIFFLKVIFGIDGYREIEISNSAKKLNKKLERHGIQSQVFVYEEWREFIAYRDVLLSKFYFPYILSPKYQGNKPYESFLAMLNEIKPEKLSIKHKATHNVLDQKREEKILNSTNLATKLLALHEAQKAEEPPMRFDFTFTPLHDAMSAIIEKLGHKLNKKIIEIDHRIRSCEFFLKPQTLKETFHFDVNLMKCTFPQTCFFKKDYTRGSSVKKFRVVFEDDEKVLKEELKKQDKESRKAEKTFYHQYHARRFKKVLADRWKARAHIVARKKHLWMLRNEKEPHEQSIFDDMLSDYEGDEEVSESDEIFDAALDDFKAELLKIEKEKEERKTKKTFTFIQPDFNLWHRNIGIADNEQKNKEAKLAELPKNFRWLLAAVANIISQDEKEIYRQLLIIELEFMKHQKPVELQEDQPQSIKKQW